MPRRSRACSVALPLALALAALLAPISVLAQDPPSDADTTEARRIASRAARDYRGARYDRALSGYQRAYQLVPAPGLLFNIGQCQRELGSHEAAIASFEQYLRERPDAPNASTVRELIAESRAAIGGGSTATTREAAALAELERARAELAASTRESDARQAEQRRQVEAAQAELAAARAELAAARRLDASAFGAPAEPEPALFERWWFWTLIGSVVVIGAGIGIAVAMGGDTVQPSGSLGTVDVR